MTPSLRPAPCGAWSSPLSASQIAAGSLRLSAPRLDRGSVYWLEGRPAESGRQVIVRSRRGLPARDVTPPGTDVRSRVHAYGGGEYLVREGAVFCVEAAGGIHRTGSFGLEAIPGPRAEARYADLELSPDRRWLLAVEELPRRGGEPEDRLVAFPLRGGPPRVVCAGYDFVSSPRFSSDGRRLAFLAWNHPNMPWDGTRLLTVEWSDDGPRGPVRGVAGVHGVSIFQPRFSPSGRLTFVSDRSGWWNFYQERDGGVRALCPREAEFGRPQWVFGLSTWAFVDEETILCAFTERGWDRLARLDLRTGRLQQFDLPLSAIEGVQVESGLACFLGAGPRRAPAVCLLDLASGRLETLRSSLEQEPEPEWIAEPEEVAWPSERGRTAHGFLYRPRSARHQVPEGEAPPLLVSCHGGPTSAAQPALDLGVQFWTTRGFAVLDVNYGGSTGYGRAYRAQLDGAWGVVDVEDCVSGAQHAAREGHVDARRMAIRGSSAGGYTALCALTQSDAFQAGCSRYGIGDLEALARETHKFEARYLDRLIGPYPQRRDLYLERSPVHHADRIRCPVLFLQGLADVVVLPSQAEAMVEALRKRGVPHAYVAFPDEQHGFRRAESIQAALEAELAFYAFAFGFDVDVVPEVLRIVR